MFPSQPQIGQDMAKERQEMANHIRQAQLAASETKQSRSESVGRGRIYAAILRHRLSGLFALPRIRQIKRLPVEEK